MRLLRDVLILLAVAHAHQAIAHGARWWLAKRGRPDVVERSFTRRALGHMFT